MPIHETVPYRKTKPKIEDIKKAILKVLLPGKTTAITVLPIARRIAHEFGVFEDDTEILESLFGGASMQRIRQACKVLFIEDRVDVVSCSRGFYIADSMKDFDSYEENIASRIRGLAKDLRAIEEAKERFRNDEGLFDRRMV